MANRRMKWIFRQYESRYRRDMYADHYGYRIIKSCNGFRIQLLIEEVMMLHSIII